MRTVLACVGEGLYELGLAEGSEDAVPGYGGDVANVAVMAAQLGCPARIGGRVGDDPLGRRLLAFWASRGVDVRHVLVDSDRPTGLYVNELHADGHRFAYLRRQSAGSRLHAGDLRDEFLADVGALHFSGITLAISDSAASAAVSAAERGRLAGALVSFAVNHRPALDPDLAQLREASQGADIVFASHEEAATVFGDDRADALVRALGAREVVVTDGSRGATVALSDGSALHRPAPSVEVVDTAGAGDALAGAYLATRLAGGSVQDAIQRGIAAAALSCRRRGCAASYPDATEVDG